jgi:enterochelin esterase-like enzyme
MRAVLQQQSYDLTYREFPAGHGYVAWRDSLVDGLQALFPPTPND